MKPLLIFVRVIIIGPILFYGFNHKSFAFDSKAKMKKIACDYFMCQYEKANIDEIILSRAKESQTVMFGEVHAAVIAGDPPPVEDSRYVISLLKSLKTIGYDYLALEVKASALPGSHSHDLVSYLDDYTKGQPVIKAHYPFAKPGWVELMAAALAYQYKLVFIDRPNGGEDRDAAMYHAMQTDIFSKDPNAKVLVYIGANHIMENESTGGFVSRSGRRKSLGFLLNQYTKGHNFSVYMGYPWDTPVGCDLFIGRFIWNTYRNLIVTNHLDHRIQPILPDK